MTLLMADGSDRSPEVRFVSRDEDSFASDDGRSLCDEESGVFAGVCSRCSAVTGGVLSRPANRINSSFPPSFKTVIGSPSPTSIWFRTAFAASV